MRIFVLLPLLIVLGGCSKAPILKYEIKGNTVTITDCDESASGKLVIPAKIEGYPVTSIGENAFIGCSLTSIIIPDSVTNIGRNAFQSCTSLTSITIPDSVAWIRFETFKYCSRLTSITIPDSVTSIGQQAFADCRGLKSITIPDRVSYIGAFAFAECNSLRAVTFLGDAPKAGQRVFSPSPPIIYRKPEAEGWGDTWDETVGDGTRDIPPVKLISEKP